MNEPARVRVIDVPVSVVTMESVLTYITENTNALKGHYICAANAHTTVMAHEDLDYRKVQQESAITLPDGKPLAVIGKRKSRSEMEKVTGTHFMQAIFADPRFRGKRHYFYGTRDADLQNMIPAVRRAYPELNICGYEPSVFREMDDTEVDALGSRIREANADFVWVALGAPRQEMLMHRLEGKTSAIMTGVGGAFHILAGTIDDAPVWMQNAGLEWFYRLCKEPKRLMKRYLVTNTKFIFYHLKNR